MSFEIIVDGKKLLWTTSFEYEDNSEPSEKTTHSGVITTPSDVGNYTVSIERASVNDYIEEQEVYDTLKKCKTEPVSVVAVKKTVKGINRTTCIGCIRTSFKESYDENGELEFTFELKADDVKKEFIKP